MCEGKALLQTVLSQPEDNTARLVLADWYQEHAQPELAEFIRVQIEISSFDPNYYISFDNWKMCSRSAIPQIRRSAELFHEAWGPWASSRSWFIGFDELHACRFRRGFMYLVCARPESWRKQRHYPAQRVLGAGEDLLRSHPVEQLQLVGVRPVSHVTMNDTYFRLSITDTSGEEMWLKLFPNHFTTEFAAVQRLSELYFDEAAVSVGMSPRYSAVEPADRVDDVLNVRVGDELMASDVEAAGV